MTTCDEVRERAAEHVLGTLSDDDDRIVRRHLRGCAACRSEVHDLSDGLGLFARAAHDREPPPELQDRVRAVLQEEWRDLDEPRGAHATARMDAGGRGGHRPRC